MINIANAIDLVVAVTLVVLSKWQQLDLGNQNEHD